jgi:hypothetical protein|tara:strand:+ start:516 stop:845 length:330 start_codon:yes stop_codon:yes gene_type:complete
MSKANMDYLWAPKDEKLVSGLLDTIGIVPVGKSQRYPTGVKYDVLVAICDVVASEDKTASMIASRTAELQSHRKATGKAPSVDSVVSALQSGKMSEADLKEAMKKAGLI